MFHGWFSLHYYKSVQNDFLRWYRLREIEMSEHDAEMYQRMLSKVRRQIQTLRIMLDAIKVSLFSHFRVTLLVNHKFKCILLHKTAHHAKNVCVLKCCLILNRYIKRCPLLCLPYNLSTGFMPIMIFMKFSPVQSFIAKLLVFKYCMVSPICVILNLDTLLQKLLLLS